VSKSVIVFRLFDVHSAFPDLKCLTLNFLALRSLAMSEQNEGRDVELCIAFLGYACLFKYK